MQLVHDVDAKILFPEVAEIEVVEGHSKTIKDLTKVVFYLLFFGVLFLMTCFFIVFSVYDFPHCNRSQRMLFL
jgi:hypothetical protein